jgi:hypothetical protein
MVLLWRSPSHVTGTRTVSNIIDLNEKFHKIPMRLWDRVFKKKNNVNGTLSKHSQDGSVINCALLEHKRLVSNQYP